MTEMTVEEFVNWCADKYLLNPIRLYDRNAAGDGYDVTYEWSALDDGGCGCCSDRVSVPPEVADFLRRHGVL